MTEEDRDSSSY